MIMGVMPSAMKPVRLAIGWLYPIAGLGHLYGRTPKVSTDKQSAHVVSTFMRATHQYTRCPAPR
jgi:hypothetical protein